MNLLRVQNRITELMARWVVSLKAAGSMSHTDLNLVSETILVPLLSEVYDLPQLRNLNTPEIPNFPAVDLADDQARVAIQVTSTANSNKIKHTLSQFVEHKGYQDYDRLIVYILVEKQKSYSGRGFDDIIGGRFHFDKKRDIRDYRDLLAVIAGLQIDRARRVLDILEANFGVKTGRPIPLQRPEPAQHFTGRDSELAELLEELQPGCLVTLCGPGGIGKTALAAQALWTLAPADQPPPSFPDGLVFYSFYGRPSTALAFEHIARSFDPSARDISPEAIHRLLSRKQALLVLDGTEQADDLGALLRVRGACGLLITTRRHADAPAEREELRPLPTGDAVDLLRAWAGERAAGKDAPARVCQLLGGLPLAVRLAGRYLDATGQTAPEYLEWLVDTPIQALSHGAHREESVEILLARSLEQVGEQARQILAVVGLLALAPFDPEPAASALELPAAAARRALGELVDYGLLLRPGERYVASHALVHTYARRRLAPPQGTAARLAACYTAFATEQSDQGLAGYARLDAKRVHLLQVLARCAQRGEWEAVRSLVWAVEDYLDMQGHWAERVAALEHGVQAARQLASQRDEEAFLILLGHAAADLGQVRQAIGYYERALPICRDLGIRQDESYALGSLGLAYAALGELLPDGDRPGAIHYHQQALAIAKEIGDRRGEGAHVSNLGLAYAALGELLPDGDRPGAIHYHQQALAIAKEIGHRRMQGNALGNLGLAYADLGELLPDGDRPGAIHYHQQALAIAKEIGDRRGEGIRLGNLGIAYKNLGETRKAIDYYQQSLVIAKEIGDRRSEGAALANLGLAHAALGETQVAIDYYQQALAIAKEIGDRRTEGSALGRLGLAYAALKELLPDGDRPGAISYYQQALAIAKEIGDRRGEAAHLGNLGLAHADLGETRKAIDYYQQSLVIAKEIGDRRSEGAALANLGQAYKQLGEPSRAHELWTQALALFEAIQDPNAERVRRWLAALEE